MSNVKTYSLSKDGNTKLSNNFTVREFRCKDGSDKILISLDTVKILQSIRDYFGKPVNINSAYRNATYNKKIGGASKSQHVQGTACDIAISGVPPEAVCAYIEKFFPNTGCGWYPTFTHVDTRGYKSRWKTSKNIVVSGFNYGNIYEKYKAVPSQPATPTKEEEIVTQEQFETMMNTYISNLAKKAPSDWSKEAREWAEKNGIIQGDDAGNKQYKKNCTREELVQILYRVMNK